MVFHIKDVHHLQEKIFQLIIYITWLLYILIALGLSANAPQYLDDLQYYVKIYISLFLIYRFNPFRQVKFTHLDAKIAFSAGLFLLTTTAINNLLQTYVKNIKTNLSLLQSNNK
jgi:hypothetical protein